MWVWVCRCGFALCVLAILYVIAGYPLWLAWRTRGASSRTPLRVSGASEPTVTILLPVFNGAAWVDQKLESILGLDYPREKIQTIVISDGSTDQTVEKAGRYSERGVEVIEIAHRGKPAAINAGLERACNEILFFTDIRQPLEPHSLRYLTACFADPQVGSVSGELMIRRGETQQEESIGLYWRYEKWLRKRESEIDSVMGATGAIYATRRELTQPLPEDLLLDDVYVPLLAFFRGYRVIFEERAIAWDDPTSLTTEFRRKVRTQAGVYQLMRYLPLLLRKENRMRFAFLSHKGGRLALPFLFLGLLIFSFGLPPLLARLSFGAQVCFYGLALADLGVPEKSRLKRITSPARTFVTLMAAAAAACSILFRNSRSFWMTATGSAAHPQAGGPN
jgi:cellulose synthase/poly-beta-1,6-N-acetylglucosamine synthase-like glycosyltransferase